MESKCLHRAFMLDHCIFCGNSNDQCGNLATIPFRFIDPNFSLPFEAINILRNNYKRTLLNSKKLHLVLDLDHTLVHATVFDNLRFKEREIIKSMDDVFELKLSNVVIVLKLRPGVREFLDEVSNMFDLSIHTRGTREYADKVVELLGGEFKFCWVIAREDCVKGKQKGFDIVLSYKQVSLIVDDTVSIWEESCRASLLQIPPYNFFPIKEGVKDMDVELARVLKMLREIHGVFYDDNNIDDFGRKDVREILKLVMENSISIGGSQEGYFGLSPANPTRPVSGPMNNSGYNEDENLRILCEAASVAMCEERGLKSKANGDWLDNSCAPAKR